MTIASQTADPFPYGGHDAPTKQPAKRLSPDRPRTITLPDTEPDQGHVLVIESSRLLAESLRALLTEHGLFPVRLARSARVALEVAVRDRPRLAIVNLELGEFAGVRLALQIVQHSPTTKVIGMVGHPRPQLAQMASNAGCLAVVSKDMGEQQLMRVVRRALASDHESAASPSPDRRIGPEPARHGPRAPLTRRETEVLRLLTEGCNTNVIAQRLDISLHTVRTHVHNILTKIGASSRLEAAALALENGLLDAGVTSG